MPRSAEERIRVFSRDTGHASLSDTQVRFITVCDKDEATDLSPAERRALKSAIDEERRQRAGGRRARGK